jgi:Uma2 family endonuclease
MVTVNTETEIETTESESVITALPLRPWTREEYYRAAELGLFKPEEKLELIDGKVFRQVSPQNHPHAFSVTKSAQKLGEAFGPDYVVLQEKPILMENDTEPEPDVVVIRGPLEAYQDHPTSSDVLLLLEVADTSLAMDTGYKASLYAWAGIADYWVLNLRKRQLEVRREPIEDTDAPFGFSYKRLVRYTEDDAVTPLSAPNAEIQVRELLPLTRTGK